MNKYIYVFLLVFENLITFYNFLLSKHIHKKNILFIIFYIKIKGVKVAGFFFEKKSPDFYPALLKNIRSF